MKMTRKNSGQTLVEFALLFPLFLFVVMGLFEIGRAVFYFAVLNNAVREGTRVAIVQSDCDLRTGDNCNNSYQDGNPITCSDVNTTANITICTAIDDKLFNFPELIDSSRTTITIDHTVNAYNEPIIHIEIQFLFAPIVPGLNLIGSFPIRVESQMLKTPVAKPIN